MKRVVLDASALMAFFENRAGAEQVEDLLTRAADRKVDLAMSAVNWGEVYYSVWRAKGPGVARKIVSEIEQLPIELVDAGQELTWAAAEMHAEHKVPYADCFAAALAVERKAEVATSDADFAKLERRVVVMWIR